jgi:hypothetical protein
MSDLPKLTAVDVANAGRALYGADWRTQLALALDLPDASLVYAVEAGTIEVPDGWRMRLIAVAQDMALRAMSTASALLCGEVDEHADASYEAASNALLV